MYKTRAQERYNQVYRIILKSLGIWPYQQTCFVRLQQMFNTGVLVLFILAQVFRTIFIRPIRNEQAIVCK